MVRFLGEALFSRLERTSSTSTMSPITVTPETTSFAPDDVRQFAADGYLIVRGLAAPG